MYDTLADVLLHSKKYMCVLTRLVRLHGNILRCGSRETTIHSNIRASDKQAATKGAISAQTGVIEMSCCAQLFQLTQAAHSMGAQKRTVQTTLRFKQCSCIEITLCTLAI